MAMKVMWRSMFRGGKVRAHKAGTPFTEILDSILLSVSEADLFYNSHSESLSMVYHVIGNTSQER